MQVFICPDEILELLDEPETAEEGETKLQEWICSVHAIAGDKLVVPCESCGGLHAYDYEVEWMQ